MFINFCFSKLIFSSLHRYSLKPNNNFYNERVIPNPDDKRAKKYSRLEIEERNIDKITQKNLV